MSTDIETARTALLNALLDPAFHADLAQQLDQVLEAGAPLYMLGLLDNPPEAHPALLAEGFMELAPEPEDLDAIRDWLIERGGYERPAALGAIKAALDLWEAAMDAAEAQGEAQGEAEGEPLSDEDHRKVMAIMSLGRAAVEAGVPLASAVDAVRRQLDPVLSSGAPDLMN